MRFSYVWPSLAAAVSQDDDADAVQWVREDPLALLEADWAGHTPLHQARSAGMARMLVQAGASLEAQDTAGLTPLAHAVRQNRGSVARVLMKSGADAKNAKLALHWAAFHGDSLLVERLLEEGGSADEIDGLGRTPLHWVFRITDRLPPEAAAVAAALVNAGADWETPDRNGKTPRELALKRCEEVRGFGWLLVAGDVWRKMHGLKKVRHARQVKELRSMLLRLEVSGEMECQPQGG